MIDATSTARRKLRSVIVSQLLRKDQYGYELSQNVSGVLAGRIRLTEGSIYPMLHFLEREGVVVARKIKMGIRVRKYYSLKK